MRLVWTEVSHWHRRSNANSVPQIATTTDSSKRVSNLKVRLQDSKGASGSFSKTAFFKAADRTFLLELPPPRHLHQRFLPYVPSTVEAAGKGSSEDKTRQICINAVTIAQTTSTMTTTTVTIKSLPVCPDGAAWGISWILRKHQASLWNV